MVELISFLFTANGNEIGTVPTYRILPTSIFPYGGQMETSHGTVVL